MTGPGQDRSPPGAAPDRDDPADFLVLGARKAGTSSLHAYLRRHPQILLPAAVHGRFFSRPEPVDAAAFRKWSASLPRRPDPAFRIGEVSSAYLSSENAPRRIRRFLPRARLVAVLRNPVERTYSEYLMQVRDGAERRPFAELLHPDQHHLRQSRYREQLQRYLDLFPREQLLLLVFDDLVADRRAFFSRLQRFLEVPEEPLGERHIHLHRGAAPRLPGVARLLGQDNPVRRLAARALAPFLGVAARQRLRRWLIERNLRPAPEMTPEERRRLVELLRPDVEWLAELLDRDLSPWLE